MNFKLFSLIGVYQNPIEAKSPRPFDLGLGYFGFVSLNHTVLTQT